MKYSLQFKAERCIINVIVAQRLDVYCEQVWLGLLFNQFPCVILHHKSQTMFRCYTVALCDIVNILGYGYMDFGKEIDPK